MGDGRQAASCVEWGVAVRPFPGEKVSGDRCAVVPRQDGMLVAVIDALGHGVEAESTARRASVILEQHAHDPLLLLIERCHRALVDDRGAVMGLVVLDGVRCRMTWAGVGNITGLFIPSPGGGRPRSERLIAPPGIVGCQLPALRVANFPLAAGDMVMLATDGLRGAFAESIFPSDEDPQRLADRLILDHAVPSDDALVLIVRYLGQS